MPTFPAMAPVRQHLTTQKIADPYTHVRTQLARSPLLNQVQPGMRIAVGVGSRGISAIHPTVTAVVDELKDRQAAPFLVPAMGSHGGGTAAGQHAVLVGYGLGEEALGVPIHSDMEAVQIAATDGGMPVYFDRFAAEADGIIVVNRIKPHTSFRARWESGLMKMLAVGLGKRQGAATLHAWGIDRAFPQAARVILGTMPVLGGVGIVENGHHEPAEIAVLAATEMEEQEPALLETAWTHFPRIPLDQLDLLVLQQIGKDISGTGMDLNVVGMWRRSGGAVTPDYRRLAVLDLTPNSHGNGIGVGYADLIPQRLYDKIDWPATYTNCLTSANFNGAKAPITLPTDRDVLLAGLPGHEPELARIVIACNTLDLETFWVSAPLLDDVAKQPQLEQIGPVQPVQFDEAGNFISA
ncbi:MAG: DUF2088 domain-containing protein [Caldilineaceae bacterium]|nr:DUF2088 domain-containing protein [Caldilineaceae bacterium]